MRRTPRWNAGSSPCPVQPPSVEDAISILRGLRERFELHHGVRIQDNALVSAVTLSNRYISDRFCSQGDRSCGRGLCDDSDQNDSAPQELDALQRRVLQLEIEEAALKLEKDESSRQRLQALRRELADARTQSSALRAKWEGKGVG